MSKIVQKNSELPEVSNSQKNIISIVKISVSGRECDEADTFESGYVKRQAWATSIEWKMAQYDVKSVSFAAQQPEFDPGSCHSLVGSPWTKSLPLWASG